MLARIPFWGWLLAILLAVYDVYNPTGYSLYHSWTAPTIDLKELLILHTVLVVTFLSLVAYAAWRAIRLHGILILTGIVGVIIWAFHSLISFDPLNGELLGWASQPIIASILTIGMQWSKLWRQSTGFVSVEDADTN